MKEFIYTCEHCGSEYTITEPGKYQCQNCNNVFTVEDQEQKQAEKLEQIRRKAEAETAKTEIFFQKKEKTETEHNKTKKYRYKTGFYILLGISCIFALITFCSGVLSLIDIIAINKKSTENMYRKTIEFQLKKIEIEQSIVKMCKSMAEDRKNESEKFIKFAEMNTKTAENFVTLAMYAKGKQEAELYNQGKKEMVKIARSFLNFSEQAISDFEELEIIAVMLNKEAKKAIEEHKKEEKILQDFRAENQYFLKKAPYNHTITKVSAVILLFFIIATCIFRSLLIKIEQNTRKGE